jgi:acyl-CoA hydrolase
VEVDAWVRNLDKEAAWIKVAEGLFVFVAIDDNGRTRAISR